MTASPTSRAPAALHLGIVLVLWAGLAAPAFADRWYEHFARAEAALANESWSQAVEQLTAALERKGDSGTRVRTYGMKVIAYLPYLKLGIAYYHSGQYDAALRAFETEERLGAVQGSPPDLADLVRYRGLALAAQQTTAAEAERRIGEIVSDRLTRSGELEGQGRLDDAMTTLDEALAVDPDNDVATTRMARLRAAVAARDRKREQAARAQTLVAEGRTLLAAGDSGAASSRFREALTLRPDAQTRDLLEQAQKVLAASLPAAADSAGQQRMVAAGLRRARELEVSRRFTEALGTLQAVLAVQPTHEETLRLEQRLLAARDAAAAEAALSATLAEAGDHFAAGRYERSLAAANRALALDPGNTEAIAHVGRAYARISRRLLGGEPARNIPPAIRFSDFRREQEDGSRVQVVSDPSFQLSGVVIDDSPVTLTLQTSAERDITSTVDGQSMGGYHVTEFRASHRLDPGPTSFHLVASDRGGLSSRSTYTVLYIEPLYRNRWLRGSSVVILLALAGGFVGLRGWRRRQLLRRRFNPYIAGAPVLDDSLLFGREALVQRVLQTVHNNSLLLYGERRIGKTSLLHHLKRRLEALADPDYEFYPVYIDLQGTPEDRFFATLAEEIFQELDPLLGDVLPSEALRGGAGYGFRDLVGDLRVVIKTLQQRGPKHAKLVLLLDEVDELNAYDPRTNQRLRSLFMKSFADSLVAVVSGVRIRKEWDREASPWYNFFEEIRVTEIDPAAAAELVTRPVKGVFRIDRDAVDRLIHIANGRPYTIQKLCLALVRRLHDDGRRRISLADVEAVEREACNTD